MNDNPRLAVLTDFDDTAAVQNVAEMLLQRFGDSTWQDVRDRFRSGELTLKDYQEITFRNINADRSAMQEYVKERANLRPFFKELWNYCQQREIPLAVVSQGLDFYIQALLDKEGLPQVPVYAVNTQFDSQGISYIYNHTNPGKEELGNSKGLIVDRFRQQGYYVIYAGDGFSDLEAANSADMLFAHRTLAVECENRQIPYHPFTDFQEVLLAVRDLHLNGHKPESESLTGNGDTPELSNSPEASP